MGRQGKWLETLVSTWEQYTTRVVSMYPDKVELICLGAFVGTLCLP